MTLKKYYYTLIFSALICAHFSVFAIGYSPSGERKSKNAAPIQDTLSWSISYVKKVFNGSGEWFMTNESYQNSIRGVMDYAQDDPIDTVVVNMKHLLGNDSIPVIFSRKAENVPNKRMVTGYLFTEEIDRLSDGRRKTVADSIRKTLIQVPDAYLADGLAKAPVISSGDPQQLLVTMDRNLPAAFISKFYKGWGSIRLPANATGAEIDTLRPLVFTIP